MLSLRYFDLRLVATKQVVDSIPEFKILHCLTGLEIMGVLRQMLTWLLNHTGEVIVLDFQHFFQFCLEDHIRLVNMLVTLFSDHLCPWPGQDLTSLNLTHLTTAGTRVIIVYPAIFSGQMRVNVNWVFLKYFWPRSLCPNPWPDTMDPDYLERFLTDSLASHRSSGLPRTLFVSQGVLTPSWRTVLRHPLSGVRQSCACACEDTVSQWLEEDKERPNIVITDFVSDKLVTQIINRNR